LYFIDKGDSFARIGALIVVIALAVEVSIQRRMNYVEGIHDSSYTRLKESESDLIERYGHSCVTVFADKAKNKMRDQKIRTEETAHLHVLVMGILGTLIWGFGDLLYLQNGLLN
jgi:hypothetical protein